MVITMLSKEELQSMTVAQLCHKLNALMVERNQLEMKLNATNEDFNAIVYELWERIPGLQDDSDIQPVPTWSSQILGRNR